MPELDELDRSATTAAKIIDYLDYCCIVFHDHVNLKYSPWGPKKIDIYHLAYCTLNISQIKIYFFSKKIVKTKLPMPSIIKVTGLTPQFLSPHSLM
jgi:hypothetical protein